MKKKVIALALILIMVSSVFVGCSLFEKNAERDYHQVVAEINYTTDNSGTLSTVVYKGELLSLVETYGPAYISYYGMTADAVVEYFYNNLTQQKLVVLYAQEYLYDNNLLPQDFKSEFSSLGAWNDYKAKNGESAAYKKFLTIDEYRYCIEQANKDFDESWNDLITELEKESDKNEGNTGEIGSGDTEEEVDDEDLLEARTQKEEEEETEEEAEYEKNDAITTEQEMIKYFAELYGIEVGENVDSVYFFNYVNELIKKEQGTDKDNMQSALKSLKDSLAKQYMDYDYFLVQQMQSYILEKYQDAIGDNLDAQKVSDNVTIKYNKQVATDTKAYLEMEDYATALGNNTNSYAAPSKDYIQVRSILLSFSESQKEAITQLGKIYANNEDFVKQLRDSIATGILGEGVDKDMVELYAKLGINVNVSNPDYDADEDKLSNAYTDASVEGKDNLYANPAVDYLTILYAMAEDIQAKVDLAMDYAEANNMSDMQKYLIKEYASRQAFDDWMYLVNDDSGMFTTDNYVITPDGQASDYVAEYTVLGRELANAGVGAMAVTNHGSEASKGTANYAGTTEILKKANGEYTIYKQAGVTSSVGEFEDEISADIYTMVTASGAEISFIVNEYGIHVIMVTGKPMDDNKGTILEQEATNDDGEAQTMFVKDRDYLYSYEVEIKYATNEDGTENKSVIESITVESETIGEYLDESTKNEMSTDVSTLQQLGLFGDDTITTKVDKIYEEILERAKELA